MAEAISLESVYQELKKIEVTMVTKEDMEMLIEQFEILHNPETMKQLAESAEDIKQGRVKEINSVQDLLSEL